MRPFPQPSCRFTPPPAPHFCSLADGPRPLNADREEEPVTGQLERTTPMLFMIVSYPWPVPSAHVELTGINRQAPGRNPRKNQPAGEPDQQRRILASSKA